MSIPDFQSMMLPFLQILADGRERFRKEVAEDLADKLKLTEEQRNLRRENGVYVFTNSLSLSEMYLFKADLLEKPQKGSLRITESGQALLQKNLTASTFNFWMTTILAQLMIEYNVGVSVKNVYEVKRIDSDYFDENEL